MGRAAWTRPTSCWESEMCSGSEAGSYFGEGGTFGDGTSCLDQADVLLGVVGLDPLLSELDEEPNEFDWRSCLDEAPNESFGSGPTKSGEEGTSASRCVRSVGLRGTSLIRNSPAPRTSIGP